MAKHIEEQFCKADFPYLSVEQKNEGCSFGKKLANELKSGAKPEDLHVPDDEDLRLFVEVVKSYLRSTPLPKPKNTNLRPDSLTAAYLPINFEQSSFIESDIIKKLSLEQISFWEKKANLEWSNWCEVDYGYYYMAHVNNCVDFLNEYPVLLARQSLDDISAYIKLVKLVRETEKTPSDDRGAKGFSKAVNHRVSELLYRFLEGSSSLKGVLEKASSTRAIDQVAKISPTLGAALSESGLKSEWENSEVMLAPPEIEAVLVDYYLPAEPVDTSNSMADKTDKKALTLTKNIEIILTVLKSDDKKQEKYQKLINDVLDPALKKLKSDCCGGNRGPKNQP